MSVDREDEMWSVRRDCSRSLVNAKMGFLLVVDGTEIGTGTITKYCVDSRVLLS